MMRLAIPLLLMPLLAACAPEHEAACTAARPVVSDGWARESLVGRAMGAAYFTIENEGDCPAILTGAASDRRGSASLHESREEDGMSRMRSIERLEIGPDERVTFAPGGKHVMLNGLDAPLVAGETFTLTLRFEALPDLAVPINVEKPGAR